MFMFKSAVAMPASEGTVPPILGFPGPTCRARRMASRDLMPALAQDEDSCESVPGTGKEERSLAGVPITCTCLLLSGQNAWGLSWVDQGCHSSSSEETGRGRWQFRLDRSPPSSRQGQPWLWGGGGMNHGPLLFITGQMGRLAPACLECVPTLAGAKSSTFFLL